MRNFSLKNKKGIALLFAVIIMALVLAIGISLSLIASKELSFSNTRRQSQIAYYSAESGTQCVLYLIANYTDAFTQDGQIHSCDGVQINTKLTPQNGTPQTSFTLPVTLTSEDPKSGYPVTIEVAQKNSTSEELSITSIGKNTNIIDSQSVQRTQQVDITRVNKNSDTDIVLALDISGSICDKQPKNCQNFKNVKTAAAQAISTLNPTGSDSTGIDTNGPHIGVIQLASDKDTYFLSPDHLQATMEDTTDEINGLTGISSINGTDTTDALELAALELTGRTITTDYFNAPIIAGGTVIGTTPGKTGTETEIPHHNRPNATKYIILFTDGLPTIRVMKDSNTRKYYQRACASYGPTLDDINNQTASVATYAKSLGIKIYTVFVDMEDTSDHKCGNYLASLSSGDGYNFAISSYNTKDIEDTFNKILSDIKVQIIQ